MRSKLAIVLVVLILMVTGAPVQQYILRQREAAQLRAGLEGLAPDEVFTTLCLAGFRGVAVDYLWVKVLNLQLQSKWHEVRALTELIARLQPNFPTVWVYNAWNLAYNISVEWAPPEDQWKWVKDGLAYLDEGLQRNPNSVQLFFEKGWIFWHKVNLGPSEGPRDFFRTRFLEDKNLNPGGRTAYEEAAYWFRLAQIIARTDDPERQHPFISKGQVEAMYYRALWAQAKELLEAGDLPRAKKLFEEVKGELEVLQDRNGVVFGFVEGFALDYREVVQTLYRINIYQEMSTGSEQTGASPATDEQSSRK
jgi:hypothetical protein